jgi:hypothetical protein
MARYFSGGLGTDAVATGLTTHATQRTYAIWARRHNTGGGNLGSMFRKRVAAAADILQLYFSTPNYNFDHTWTTGGQWTMTAPSIDVWHHVCVTYDSGATTNLPVFYIDGASVAVGTTAAPTGTVNTNADAFVIGNRNNDGARAWDGDLAEFAVWDTILTATEVAAVAGGTIPTPLGVQTANLIAYYPLELGLSPEPDASSHQTAGTVTGTVRSQGPHDLWAHVINRPPFIAQGRN